MIKSMRAARFIEARLFSVEEFPVPVPGAGEILVRIDGCGVCKSEFGYWIGEVEGSAHPGAGGHEFYGVITELGDGVDPSWKGRVVTGITEDGGGYAEYLVSRPELLAPLPDNCRDQPILGEPYACAINAVLRAEARLGDAVLLIGCGYMGALALTLLKRSGVAPLVVAEVSPFNRELALRLGADRVIDPSASICKEEVDEITRGEGFDLVMEAAGNQKALDLATETVKIRGRIVSYGYHNTGGRRSIDMERWNFKGVDIVNGHERDPMVYMAGVRRALELFRWEKPGDLLLTHTFPLEEINAAFALIEERPTGFVKGLVTMR